MDIRYEIDKKESSEFNKYFIEIDITEKEMQSIKEGHYPEKTLTIYKTDEKGNLVSGSEVSVIVSIGLTDD